MAERLDPEKLAAAGPGTHWDVRVDALKALIQIRTGERKQGIARLGVAVETLREVENAGLDCHAAATAFGSRGADHRPLNARFNHLLTTSRPTSRRPGGARIPVGGSSELS